MINQGDKIVVLQCRKIIKDIISYKGEWYRVDIFEKFVDDLNHSAQQLGLSTFKFQPFHYSSTGKTINDNGYESLMNHIDLIEKMIPSLNFENEIHSNQSNKKVESKKVFIVHGRDRSALLETESMISRLGLEPIVLSRMANSGQTLIEKFERHSDVIYAVVLLTPDDVGGLYIENEKPDLRFRARQNVIFELGFFYAKLGRSKVCCINKSSVDIPSDINGVAYLPYLKSVEEVELPLIKELKEAKIQLRI
ncbi:nucleotide-binding protein [Paenibacillus taichungensis]|uniref:nucleotide-binding protein n=1 Tax=Paenibacillus taichungensis TaxID=484184 RepID=UPI002DC031BB|nr:nucleotide-binding protein [Paenibacillus taichungensis]MEC0106777.1 nucleotide-binding protein [Paenibacillus taichungensis]MEC0195293.1 nucleotide-binding protein [Paenibacillus taichungensis]